MSHADIRPHITIVEVPLNLKRVHTVKYSVVVMDKCTTNFMEIRKALQKMHEYNLNAFIFLYDISRDVKDCYDFSLLELDHYTDKPLNNYKFYTVQPMYLGNMFNEETELVDKLDFIKDYTLKVLSKYEPDTNETMEYVLEFLHYINR